MDNNLDFVISKFSSNSLVFGMFFFPHYFRDESPPFHLKIIQESIKANNLAIQAPRGSAKSVLLTFLMPTHDIVFKKCHFIIIVMNTYAKAAAALENIKNELRTNEKIKMFGIKMRKDAEGDTIFLHPDGFEIRVLCKGADQLGSIRGERFGAYRPQRIIVDDLEDDKSVRNIELRQNLEREFNDVLNYAGDNTTKITVIGTILHDDSLMAKLVSQEHYANFTKLFFKARYTINGQLVSIWKEKWSIEKLSEMEAMDPAGFAKEMMGDPASGSQEAFKRDDFRRWKIENNNAILFDKDNAVIAKYSLSDCRAAISCDLAWEEKRDSDSSVIFPAFLTPSNEVLFDSYICKRGLRPDEAEEILFNMEERLQSLTKKRVVIGFEKAKLEKVMKWLLGQAMKRRNKWLWLENLQWDGDKLQRIMIRLANRYSQHIIFHKEGMGELENQLVRLRSTAHDDIADAAQGVVQLFDRFGPSKVKKTQDDTDGFELLRSFIKKKEQRKQYVIGAKKKNNYIIEAKTTFK